MKYARAKGDNALKAAMASQSVVQLGLLICPWSWKLEGLELH